MPSNQQISTAQNRERRQTRKVDRAIVVMAQLSYARYGKDNIRLLRKAIPDPSNPSYQTVTELTVCTLLEGDIETSYTKADNSVVVPTDTQKQTTYILAKQNPVSPPETFAAILADHFVTTYRHIRIAHVSIVQHKWTRVVVDGQPHPHAFYRDGEDKRTVECKATEQDGKVSIDMKSGISDLLMLKSTGSAFYGYDTADEFTILPETQDRILSTSVDAAWSWSTLDGLDAVKAATERFDSGYDSAKKITMDTFAKENSPSVQNTMFKMSEQILDAIKEVDMVEYKLPNKHYFEISKYKVDFACSPCLLTYLADLSWHKGLKNTGKDAEVYAPQRDPNGLINCKVTREGKQLEVR